MDALGVLFNRIDAFLLILSRVSGALGIAPVFASQRVPMTVRAGLAALLAFIITVSRIDLIPPVESLLTLAGGIAGEFIFGFAMGYIVYLVMAAAQTAGQVIDMQMGFGIVNVLDPQSGTQLPLVGNLQYLLAMLVLLAIDGHHLMISGIVNSYDLVPVLGFKIDGGATGLLVSLFCGMFVSALKIALPLTASLLVADVALGIVARTVPQMNVFIVGLPLKIVVGILMLSAVLGVYLWLVGRLLNDAFRDLDLFFRLLAV